MYATYLFARLILNLASFISFSPIRNKYSCTSNNIQHLYVLTIQLIHLEVSLATQLPYLTPRVYKWHPSSSNIGNRNACIVMSMESSSKM